MTHHVFIWTKLFKAVQNGSSNGHLIWLETAVRLLKCILHYSFLLGMILDFVLLPRDSNRRIIVLIIDMQKKTDFCINSFLYFNGLNRGIVFKVSWSLVTCLNINDFLSIVLENSLQLAPYIQWLTTIAHNDGAAFITLKLNWQNYHLIVILL